MGYKIITDSTIDMDHKMIEELGLTVVPLRFTIDGKTYKDKADLSDMPTETFYAKLREGKMSTTSQINADEFTRVFEPVLQGGEDVLYIAFSSGLSGTCQSADCTIVLDARLPRTLAGLLVGGALGLAGALMQTLTRNPLADPGLLGVNAGASFAIVLGAALLGITSPGEQLGLAF